MRFRLLPTFFTASLTALADRVTRARSCLRPRLAFFFAVAILRYLLL